MRNDAWQKPYLSCYSCFVIPLWPAIFFTFADNHLLAMQKASVQLQTHTLILRMVLLRNSVTSRFKLIYLTKISSAGPRVPVLQVQVKTLHIAMNQPDINRNISIEAANELDKSKTKFHSGIPQTILVVARSKT
jgi:hypothetical protein